MLKHFFWFRSNWFVITFSYEVMKKNQENAKKIEEELEEVRAQVELANRKAEEAKERNALLRAHLLDKEEIENENIAMKRRGDKPLSKNHQVNFYPYLFFAYYVNYSLLALCLLAM